MFIRKKEIIKMMSMAANMKKMLKIWKKRKLFMLNNK